MWRFRTPALCLCLCAAATLAHAQAPVYHSVGTSTVDLKNGAPTVTISTGTVTFSLAQPDNVGVGDQITYNGGTIAFISSRSNSTVYTVTTATGGVPPPVTNAAVDSIRRAFNGLGAAVTDAANASHLNTTKLVGSNLQLQDSRLRARGRRSIGAAGAGNG